MDSGPLVQANNPVIREMQPTQGSDLGRPAGPRSYPDAPSARIRHRRIHPDFAVKRKWVVVGCLATIFSVVAIASLKMTPVYEASGTIEINKPDTSLNFQNSATFSLDYFDPTELETEVKILQSDLAGSASHPGTEPGPAARSSPVRRRLRPQHRDLAPDPLQTDPSRAAAMVGGFKGNLQSRPESEHPHHRGPLPQP